MEKFKFFFILFLFIFSLVSCSDYTNKKGKKGDFSFRKCTICNISND